eukprot:GILI01012098.1.p1 GENE.GILI01012098.1~~GILI01012098.1.p1  ORF type:complete len:466 (+),score=69.33 GILI01012098.1:35-1399(+)
MAEPNIAPPTNIAKVVTVRIKSTDGAQAKFDVDPNATVRELLVRLLDDRLLQGDKKGHLHRLPKKLLWRDVDLRTDPNKTLADVGYDEDDKVGIQFVPYDDEDELIEALMVFQLYLRSQINVLKQHGDAFVHENENRATSVELNQLEQGKNIGYSFDNYVKELSIATRSFKVVWKLLENSGEVGKGSLPFGVYQEFVWPSHHAAQPDCGYCQHVKPPQASALVPAICKGHYEMVSKLLEYDVANVACDQAGRFPLQYAIQFSTLDMVELLVTVGKADINKPTTDGLTPLLLAAKLGQNSVLNFLISSLSGEAIAKDKEGNGPLHIAAIHGQADSVDYMLQHSEIDSTAVNSVGHNALHLASIVGQVRVVKTLVQHAKALDINAADADGHSALHLAALHGRTEVVEVLIAQPDININFFDKDKNNAARLAAANGHVGLAGVLHTAMSASLQCNDF